MKPTVPQFKRPGGTAPHMNVKAKSDRKPRDSTSDLSRTCFVATPIGAETSDVRKSADGLLNEVVVPELTSLGFDVVVPHQMSTPGSITSQVVEHLIESSLVVANLTGLNPNVMYELAVRHATQKPIVILAEASTVLPFDVSDQRTLFFENNMMGAFRLRPAFRAAVTAAMDQGEVEDNPIYRGRAASIIKSQPGTPDTTKYIIDRLEGLERLILDFGRRSRKREPLAYRSRTLTVSARGATAELDKIHRKLAAVFPDCVIEVRDGQLTILADGSDDVRREIVTMLRESASVAEVRVSTQ